MIRETNVSEINKIVELKLKMFEESGHLNLLHKDVKDIVEREYSKMYTEQKALHFIEE